MDAGRIKLIRAVVRISQVGADRYCARVSFPFSGLWSITVRHKDRSGEVKAVFLLRVNGQTFAGPAIEEDSTDNFFTANSLDIRSLSLPLVAPGVSAQIDDRRPGVPDYGTEETLTGIVSDARCRGRHNRKLATPYSCTRECVQEGAAYALIVGHTMYLLEGHRTELDKLAGGRATVNGRLNGTIVLVSSVTNTKKEVKLRNYGNE